MEVNLKNKENNPNKNPLTIVIFGATGNLYADKLAKALLILFQENKLPSNFKILGFARKDFNNDSFRTYTKENIFKKSEVNTSNLEEFLSHIEYFHGDFSTTNDFLKLKELLSREKNGSILFHLATASVLYEKIFENIKTVGLHMINENESILIEKPFGRNENDAIHLQNILATLFPHEKIFHVDHYLAKETAEAIFNFRFIEGLQEESWNNKNIQKIKVIFHESNIVGTRAASYDSVGAFRDVGENHMLELLALTIMNKPNSMDAESIRLARAKAIENLYIDSKHQVTKGQYSEYVSHMGVRTDSQTETFFRVFLQSNDSRFAGIDFELEGGKGLVDLHSDVTTTTVAVEVYFKNGDKKEFKIQPVTGTAYDAYVKVYDNAIHIEQILFVSMEEIIAEWKLADELLAKWTNIPLVIYKKGANPEEIK